MTRLDRMISLYNQLGLNTDSGTFNRAELRGYCAGMDMLDSLMHICIDEQYVSKEYVLNFSSWFRKFKEVADELYTYGTHFVFENPDLDKVGLFLKNWCIPYLNAYFDGNGVPWQSYNKSWTELESRLLRWTMIETMGGI